MTEREYVETNPPNWRRRRKKERSQRRKVPEAPLRSCFITRRMASSANGRVGATCGRWRDKRHVQAFLRPRHLRACDAYRARRGGRAVLGGCWRFFFPQTNRTPKFSGENPKKRVPPR